MASLSFEVPFTSARLCWSRGYLRVVGPAIQSICGSPLQLPKSAADLVPELARRERAQRDCTNLSEAEPFGEVHVTLLNREELSVAMNGGGGCFHGTNRHHLLSRHGSVEALVTELHAARVAECDDIFPIGLGKVAKDDGVSARSSYFVSCLWPSGQAAREILGFPPKDFHITLGFVTKDIHDVPKGVATLIWPRKATDLIEAATQWCLPKTNSVVQENILDRAIGECRKGGISIVESNENTQFRIETSYSHHSSVDLKSPPTALIDYVEYLLRKWQLESAIVSTSCILAHFSAEKLLFSTQDYADLNLAGNRTSNGGADKSRHFWVRTLLARSCAREQLANVSINVETDNDLVVSLLSESLLDAREASTIAPEIPVTHLHRAKTLVSMLQHLHRKMPSNAPGSSNCEDLVLEATGAVDKGLALLAALKDTEIGRLSEIISQFKQLREELESKRWESIVNFDNISYSSGGCTSNISNASRIDNTHGREIASSLLLKTSGMPQLRSSGSPHSRIGKRPLSSLPEIPIKGRLDIVRHIYLDLDGVMADFDGGVRALSGGLHPDDMRAKDMWRLVYRCPWNPGGFFGNLGWQPNGGKPLWEALRHWGPQHLSILTGLPMGDNRWAADGKRLWCRRWLTLPNETAAAKGVYRGVGPPGFSEVVCCMSRDKVRYAGEKSLLIDDRLSNGEAWAMAGGIFVHHVSLEDTLSDLQRLGVVTPEIVTSAIASAAASVQHPRFQQRQKYKSATYHNGVETNASTGHCYGKAGRGRGGRRNSKFAYAGNGVDASKGVRVGKGKGKGGRVIKGRGASTKKQKQKKDT